MHEHTSEHSMSEYRVNKVLGFASVQHQAKIEVPYFAPYHVNLVRMIEGGSSRSCWIVCRIDELYSSARFTEPYWQDARMWCTGIGLWMELILVILLPT